MEAHERIVKDLNEEFKKVDRAFQTSEVRIFGKNTGRIFRELDVIRRKQINLASEHVSLEAIHDIPPNQSMKASAKSNQDSISYSAKSFNKKEAMLKNMMKKLDDLTQAMDRFKKISEHDYDGNDTLILPEENKSNNHEEDEEEEDALLNTNTNRNSRSEVLRQR